MSCKTPITLFFVLSLSFNPVQADTTLFVSSGIQSHYGFIIPHSMAIKDVSHTRPFGLEIDHCRWHTSLSEWKVFNAYWISGLNASWFNYQYPDVLGNVFMATAFAEPVLAYGRNLMFTVRGGMGLSFHTKRYDPVENPLNKFFSTRVSFPVYLDARLRYRAGDQTFITLSGCYNHISNGGIKLPNKGMNFPTVALGLEHHRHPIPYLEKINTTDTPGRGTGLYLLMQVLSSVKVHDKTADSPERAYFIYGLHSRVSKRLGSLYALNGGAEMIVDNYIRESVRREARDLDHKRLALTLGQEFLLGRAIFSQHLGFYIYSPYRARNPLYQKYELMYSITGKALLGVYIKSHMQVAELMGLSFNYRLVYGKGKM